MGKVPRWPSPSRKGTPARAAGPHQRPAPRHQRGDQADEFRRIYGAGDPVERALLDRLRDFARPGAIGHYDHRQHRVHGFQLLQNPQRRAVRQPKVHEREGVPVFAEEHLGLFLGQRGLHAEPARRQRSRQFLKILAPLRYHEHQGLFRHVTPSPSKAGPGLQKATGVYQNFTIMQISGGAWQENEIRATPGALR